MPALSSIAISSLVAGGLLGATAGAIPKTAKTTTTSQLELDPMVQGGLEELLSGKTEPVFSKSQEDELAKIRAKMKQIDSMKHPKWGRAASEKGAAKKKAKLQLQLEQIEANPAETRQGEPGLIQQNMETLQGLISAGPGQQDVESSLDARRELASLLGMTAENGGLPTSEDISQTGTLAADLFQGQREAQRQAFEEQNQQGAQLAAQLGRGVGDPVVQQRLRQQQLQQSAQLDANQGSLAAQLAMQQPDRRIGYATQQSDVLQGLANQALQARTGLIGVGQQLQQGERNFRIAQGKTTQTSTSKSGGGLGGAVSGALGGAGAGLQIAGAFNKLSSGSGAGGGGGGGYSADMGNVMSGDTSGGYMGDFSFNQQAPKLSSFSLTPTGNTGSNNYSGITSSGTTGSWGGGGVTGSWDAAPSSNYNFLNMRRNTFNKTGL